jgi:hypothetical protein
MMVIAYLILGMLFLIFVTLSRLVRAVRSADKRLAQFNAYYRQWLHKEGIWPKAKDDL